MINMKNLATIGGVLGILISITAQLFAVIDDSYTFGNIWFLGVFAGMLSIIGAAMLNKNKKMGSILLIVSSIIGYYGIGFLYLLPGLITLFIGMYMQFRREYSH